MENLMAKINIFRDFFISLCYVGKLPRSGLCGTLASLPIYYLFYEFGFFTYALLTLILTILSLILIHFYEKQTKTNDSTFIVIDECIGFLMTMFLIPSEVFYVILGFVIFRYFDSVKPLGIRFLERHFKNAFGVIIDDVVAGLYSNLILQALVYLHVLEKIKEWMSFLNL